MSLVPAKCPECGGIVKIDNSKDAGICIYCGTPFITQKAINNYVTNVNTTVIENTNINANTVHYHEDQLNRFFVIENGTLIKYNGNSKKITIPSNVISIREKAFGDAFFDEVVIGRNVVEIEKYALRATTVVIPEDTSLSNLGHNSIMASYMELPEKLVQNTYITKENIDCDLFFYHGSYKSLCESGRVQIDKDLVFPNFKGISTTADGFTYAHNGNEAIILSLKRDNQASKEIHFPSTVDGYRVTDISCKALRTANNTYMGEIYLPKGLKTLRGIEYDRAGYIYIPASVTEFIGKSKISKSRMEIELEKKDKNYKDYIQISSIETHINMPNDDGVAWGKLSIKNKTDYPAIIYTNYSSDSYNEEYRNYSDKHTKLFTVEPNAKFEGKVPLNYSIVLKKDPNARDLYKFIPDTNRRPAGTYRIEHDTEPKVFPEDFITVEVWIHSFTNKLKYYIDNNEYTLTTNTAKHKLAPGEHEFRIGKKTVKLDGQDTRIWLRKKLFGHKITTYNLYLRKQEDHRSMSTK